MNKARIEELADQVFREWANEAAVKKALIAVALECYEDAAAISESLTVSGRLIEPRRAHGYEIADVIRSRAAELEGT